MDSRKPRRVLHERSESENNSKSLEKSNSTTCYVSDEVSLPALPPAAAVSQNRDPKKTIPVISDTTSSNGNTTRSSTLRSVGTHRTVESLESLPPVPPLRIQKERNSLPLDWTESATLQGTQTTFASSSRKTIFLTLPQGGFGKLADNNLPPLTAVEYERVSKCWPSEESNHPNLPRHPPTNTQNQTLRLVDGNESNSVPHSVDGRQPNLIGPDIASNDIKRKTESGHRQFPAWARYFYGKREEQNSITADSNTSEGQNRNSDRSPSLVPTHTQPTVFIVPSSIGPSRVRDASDVATIWSIPHLDEPPPSRLHRIDRQIILFCLGFLLPPFWFVAACLPLPIKQDDFIEGSLPAQFIGDALPRTVQADRNARIQNSRWWRIVNRIMSVVGVGVITTVVVLALVAALA